jgi:hypothetical protein
MKRDDRFHPQDWRIVMLRILRGMGSKCSPPPFPFPLDGEGGVENGGSFAHEGKEGPPTFASNSLTFASS